MGFSQKDAEPILQEQLGRIRKKAGLSQKELANKLGKPQSFVSKSEKGQRELKAIELFWLCQTCGTTAEEFCKSVEEQLRDQGPPHSR